MDTIKLTLPCPFVSKYASLPRKQAVSKADNLTPSYYPRGNEE